MEIKPYKKEVEYSYSLGAYPTVELIKKHKNDVIKIIYASSFNNENVKKEISSLLDSSLIEVNDKLINKLSTKENSYVIGVFKKYDTSLDKDADHLLLDSPMNMGNLGTIIRSSHGFGIKNIAIIRPASDIFDPKVVRSSMGSIFSINFEYFDSIDDYKAKYNNHRIYSFMLQATKSLKEVKFTSGPLTLAFGNESSGLPMSYLNDDSIIIKHSNEIDSLNITNAVSIALYEYSKKVNF